MYNNKKDKEKDTKYRKVEAMWRRGCSVDEIVRSVKLSKMDVLDVTKQSVEPNTKLTFDIGDYDVVKNQNIEEIELSVAAIEK